MKIMNYRFISIIFVVLGILSISFIAFAQIQINGPKLLKIEDGIYEITEDKSTFSTAGNVVPWFKGYRLFMFEIKSNNPLSLSFVNAYDEFYKFRFSEYGSRIQPIKVVSVTSKYEVEGQEIPKAYRHGVVEEGIVIMASNADGSENEWGCVRGFQ